MAWTDGDDPGRIQIWYLILLYLSLEFDITLHYPYGRPDETFYVRLTLVDTLELHYPANR